MLVRFAALGAPTVIVLAAVSTVLTPLPPDALGSISIGCLALGASAALWLGGSQATRRMLAVVVAVAGVRVGFAFDARPAQIGALVIIAAALITRLRAMTSRPARRTAHRASH